MKNFLWLVILAIGAGPQAKDENPKKAVDLVKEALAQAKEGKKRILLTFGAPG